MSKDWTSPEWTEADHQASEPDAPHRTPARKAALPRRIISGALRVAAQEAASESILNGANPSGVVDAALDVVEAALRAVPAAPDSGPSEAVGYLWRHEEHGLHVAQPNEKMCEGWSGVGPVYLRAAYAVDFRAVPSVPPTQGGA